MNTKPKGMLEGARLERLRALLAEDPRLGVPKAAAALGLSPHDRALRNTVQALKGGGEPELPVITMHFEEPAPEPEVKRSGLEIVNDNVVRNWTTRTIITDLGDYGSYRCSFERHAAILRAYSNDWGSGPENQEELARRFGLANAHAAALYVRHHGWRHTSPPVTDEEILEGVSEEDAVEATLRSHRQGFHQKLQRRKWEDVQKAAERWWSLEQSVVEPLVEAIHRVLPRLSAPVRVDLAPSAEPYLAVVGAQDLHLGKLAFDQAGGVAYDRRIAMDRLRDTTARLSGQLTRFGRPERVQLILGSDDLHVDNFVGTTAGTSQMGQTDGSFEVLFDPWVDALLWQVEHYRQIAPVTATIVPGNHNRVAALLAGRLIEEVYRDAPDVRILRRPTAPRLMTRFGSTGLCFLHGDGWSDAKLKSSVHKLVFSEAREQGVDVARVERWLVVSGHVHHLKEIDLGGVTLATVPALSPPDAYHRNEGWVASREMQVAHLVGERSGPFARFSVG